MPERIPVAVYARDPISQAGIASQLRTRPEVTVAENGDAASAMVAIVVADEIDEPTIQTMRAVQRGGCKRVLLVATRLDDGALLSAVEAGACGMLRRSEAVTERLLGAIRTAAAGDGTVPPDLLGRLLDQVGRLQRQVLAPRGLTFAGLTDRET